MKQKTWLAPWKKAFKEDDQILVEEFIAGREFTIGVFEVNQRHHHTAYHGSDIEKRLFRL